MSFAQEMKDFTSAFSAMSNVLGTRSSREAARLDNEHRRATIEWTRARTAEIMGPQIEFGDWLTTATEGWEPLDKTPGTTSGPSDAARATVVTGAGAGAVDLASGPKVKSVSAKTAALDDSDLSGTGADTLAGGTSRDKLGGGRRSYTPYDVAIKDRTSWRGMQPRALKIMDAVSMQAQQMGIRLVVTAGKGGGHRSHAAGTEVDLVGYHQDGSKWNPRERAIIAMAGGRVGANRFGLYPGGSLHIGYGGGGRPSAVWGAGGVLKGPSARNFRNPADREFLTAFQSGKLYGSSSDDFLVGSAGSDGFPAGGDGQIDPEVYIRRAARARGIDPEVAVRVARSEGLAPGVWQSNYVKDGKRETSYGPFQLLVGGGLGDEFIAKGYGDPRDPRTVYRQIDFALDKAAENGWGAWYGAAKVGVGNRTGLDGARALGVSAPLGEGGGGVAGRVGGDNLRGGVLDDEMAPSYPEARTKDDELAAPEPEPVAASPVDIAAGGAGVPIAPKRDTVHEVEQGDTLWDLANRYNLESYLKIVAANPQIVNPDLIYPEQKLVIPEGLQEADIPTPRMRGDGAVAVDEEPPAEANPMTSSTANTMAVPNPPPRPVEGYTPYDNPPGEVRPAGGPGALPPDSYTPTSDEPEAELQRALNRRREVEADLTMPPATRDAMMQALDVKIQQLSHATGGTGSYTPTETVRPVEARPTGAVDDVMGPAEIGKRTSDYRSSILGTATDPDVATRAFERTLQEGVGRARAVEDSVLNPGDSEEGVSLQGAAATDALVGQSAGDNELGPAQTSIREVTDAWDIGPTGHVRRPDGREAANDTFTDGKRGALAGSNWLSNVLFGEGVDDTDLAEDAAPDDDMPDAATAKLTGKYAMGQSQVAQAQNVVRAWAEQNDVELTESELNQRTLGLLYGYWVLRDPEKAAAIAASYIQYNQVRYNQYSAIAKAALGEGDTEKAVEAAVKAYAQIPDGRDFDVQGDATTGYTVRYTDEETGKVITEKVLTPQEMTGMILNMSPGDVDKFLVKAAGEDELPEASPQLTKLLADLDAVPPDQRPAYNALATAELDGDEQQIYNTAFNESVRIWTDTTGGSAAAAQRETVEQILGPAEAPAATPAATPATPAATPAAPKPTSALDVDSDVSDDTLIGSDKLVTSESKPLEVAPGVRAPGKDKTFGLGPPPDIDLYKATSARDPSFGLDLSEAKNKQDVAAYNRELAQHQTAYYDWLVRQAGAKPEEKPAGSGAPTGLQGGWLGDEGPVVRAQQERPWLAPALQPVLPPGPSDGPDGFNMPPKPSFNPDSLLGLPEEYQKNLLYKAERAEEAWKELRTKRSTEFDRQLAAIEPVPRDLYKEEVVGITDDVDKYISDLETDEEAPLTKGEAKQLRNQQTLIGDAAQLIAKTNGSSMPSAIKLASEMVLANPANPSVPDWRAWPHPNNPGVMLVQPLNGQGRPDGAIRHIPNSMFDPLAQAWREDADRYIDMGAASYATKVTTGALPTSPVTPEAEAAQPGFVEKMLDPLVKKIVRQPQPGELNLDDWLAAAMANVGEVAVDIGGAVGDALALPPPPSVWKKQMEDRYTTPEEYKRLHPIAPPTGN